MIVASRRNGLAWSQIGRNLNRDSSSCWRCFTAITKAKWTPVEDTDLIKLCEDGRKLEEISAQLMGRTAEACRSCSKYLKAADAVQHQTQFLLTSAPGD